MGGIDLSGTQVAGRHRDNPDADLTEARLESYKRLADVFHHVLSEQDLETLLERVADTLAELVPYDTLTIYEAKEADGLLIPVLARDQWAEEILNSVSYFGEGITGWAVEHRQPVLTNDACNDPRVRIIPGTPADPEALISVPLIARGVLKGALNIYRVGVEGHFTEQDFELAIRFGDAAALALDNAQKRAALEREAQTDSLTGLYNHRFFQERLRAELNRVSRTRDSVSLLMLDIDDFKKINDVHGHGVGDQVLTALARMMGDSVRASDVVCRLGGEEFAVILPSCDAGDALVLATRIRERVTDLDVEPAGRVTVSIGVAQGPEHATNPRELLACADAAMLMAKGRGKDRIVVYDDNEKVGSVGTSTVSDVRSIAHLKMLQSVTGKLNRLNNVKEIGFTIANELRTLIDYHSCLVHLLEGDRLVPIAARGELAVVLEREPDMLERAIGEGIIGHAAQSGRSVLVENALDFDKAVQVPGTPAIEESIIAVPLSYGALVIGVIVISKLGVAQFDDDDVRLLEVLSGHASVALENARLYESQLRETENAKSLLDFADAMSHAGDFHAIGEETVVMAARLLESAQSSLWLQSERTGEFYCAAHNGYIGDPTAAPIIKAKVSQASGEALLEDRKGPFVMTPEDSERYFSTPDGVVSRNLAIAPLHGVAGWITVRHPQTRLPHFSEERMRLLAGLSYQASVAMQKALLYRDQKENAEIANALLEFGRDLASADGIEEVLDRSAAKTAQILGSPKTSCWIEDPKSGDMTAAAWWGYEGPDVVSIMEARIPSSVARSFFPATEPFVVTPDQIKVLDVPHAQDAELSYAVAPMKLEGDRVAVIVAAAPALGQYEFSERKMRLLGGIAHQARLAINNANSFENLEETFLSTVEALANALEAKDEYTSSHARWISDMSLEVGEEIGLDVPTMKRLELGALFHDIGKIGIPSDILLKPGPLNDAEWEIIKTHPELGEKILAPIDRLADVRPIVRHCHEHYDGGGYPDKKRGDEIPVESRIILVVDAFHAMTSDRSYRRALPLDEACRRLRKDSGVQFDPEIVEAFLRVIEKNPELATGH